MSTPKDTVILARVNPSFSYLLKNPVVFLGFGFGSGLSPYMPGTAGTLAAIPLYLLISQLPLPAYCLVLLIASAVGVAICGISARKLGVHDHGGIVWDEFVGLWITLLAAPKGWPWLVLGFVLFRIFDMAKPWPISVLDRSVKGGWGIMLDDIVAGIAAAGVLQLSHFVYVSLI